FQRRPRRRTRREIRSVGRVHLLEPGDVGDEDARADDVAVAHAGGFVDGRTVVEHGPGLRGHVALDDRVVLAVAADQAGEEQRVAGPDTITVRIRRLNPVARVNGDALAAGGGRG